MKSFDEFREQLTDSDLQESRLLRKGIGIAFSAKSKTYGNKSVQSFKTSQNELKRPTPPKDQTDLNIRMTKLENGLVEMNEGLINMRYQLGSLVAMVNVIILMNERSDLQIKKLMRGKRR